MRRAPAPDERQGADDERFGGHGNGGFEVAQRPAGGRRIEVARHDDQALERAGVAQRLELPLQPRLAGDVAFDGGAALARQRVGVVLQPGDAFGRRQRTARRLRVERGDDPAELVERAAEPLTVLLREFRPLRADETAQEADRQGQSSRQHRQTPRRRAQAIARLGKSHTPH